MGEIVHPDFRLPRPSADGSRAKMSGSMVAEFVNQARNKSAASADSEDQITEDYVLLTLGDWPHGPNWRAGFGADYGRHRTV
jgi:hypothetical protein